MATKYRYYKVHPGWIENIDKQLDYQLWEIEIRSRRICIVRKEEEWYALDAKCPHQGGPMAKGELSEQGELLCPWHRFAFDLQTGQCAKGGYYLNTYELKWENESLYIRLPIRKSWFG